jgi:hypothetical protein
VHFGARVHFAPVRMTEAQPRSPRYLSEQETRPDRRSAGGSAGAASDQLGQPQPLPGASGMRTRRARRLARGRRERAALGPAAPARVGAALSRRIKCVVGCGLPAAAFPRRCSVSTAVAERQTRGLTSRGPQRLSNRHPSGLQLSLGGRDASGAMTAAPHVEHDGGSGGSDRRRAAPHPRADWHSPRAQPRWPSRARTGPRLVRSRRSSSRADAAVRAGRRVARSGVLGRSRSSQRRA